MNDMTQAAASYENRLQLTVLYLSSVSRTLAAETSIEVMLLSLTELGVPSVFAGMHIVAKRHDDRTNIDISRGLGTGKYTVGIPILSQANFYGMLEVFQQTEIDDLDRMIATDLATRLATVFDTHRILARQQLVADTLQRALLPQYLPTPKKISISAAYQPANDDATVGGDWYDVFTLPDGRLAFSIGDVAGHGLHAAVIMGEVRQAFRAAAVNPKSPSLVLERANTIVNMRDDAAIVTAVFGIFDQELSTLTYASAGHPAPILATLQRTPQVLSSSGIPLGVSEQLHTDDWTITLAPGSIFALYTDGLIEFSRDIVSGERDLLAAVGAQTSQTTESIAQNVVDAIFAERSNIDDAAMLVLKAPEITPERFYFAFSARPLFVPLLRDALTSYLQSRETASDLCHEILLAVGEAAANAVEHAYSEHPNIGVVRVDAHHEGDNLFIEIRDEGRWKPTEKCDERGRGIQIIRAICEQVEIKTAQAETVVKLTVRVRS